MGRTYVRWTDAEVEEWALVYLETHTPVMLLEQELGVPHSTLWWC